MYKHLDWHGLKHGLDFGLDFGRWTLDANWFSIYFRKYLTLVVSAFPESR